MANARCPGCGMMAADPLGHLAHGMAQNTPEPTFAGLTVEEILWREGKVSIDGIRAAQAEVDALQGFIDRATTTELTPIETPLRDALAKPRNKGGRPRKA